MCETIHRTNRTNDDMATSLYTKSDNQVDKDFRPPSSGQICVKWALCSFYAKKKEHSISLRTIRQGQVQFGASTRPRERDQANVELIAPQSRGHGHRAAGPHPPRRGGCNAQHKCYPATRRPGPHDGPDRWPGASHSHRQPRRRHGRVRSAADFCRMRRRILTIRNLLTASIAVLI